MTGTQILVFPSFFMVSLDVEKIPQFYWGKKKRAELQ